MIRALVTGAAGFIGSHLCELLIRHDYNVVGIDNFSNGTASNHNAIVAADLEKNPKDPRFAFKEIDVTHSDSLDSIFKWHAPEVVFHQAALGSIPRSLENPYWTMQNNVFGFHNILEMCRKHKVRRLVYASSSSVYGGNPRLIKYEGEVADALNPYALSKQINESQAKTWARAYGVESVGLRYFNVFGERQNRHSQYAAVIAKWLGCIQSGEQITVYGSGEQMRDFTHVDNVTYANVLASMVPIDSVNNAYNVGAGRAITLKHVLKEICTHAKRLGYDIPEIKHEAARPNDVQGTCADLSRAKKWLGYEPQVDFTTGIQRTCDSVLRRQHG